MPLKQSLTAADYAALPEAERGNYKLLGTDYVPDVEGVENLPGLVTAYEREHANNRTLEEQLKPFKGLTAERVAELLALEQSSRLGKLTSKGAYDDALATVKSDYETKLTDMQKRLNEQALDHGLDTVLLKSGVIPDRLGNAKKAAKDHVRVAENGTLEVIGSNGQPSGVEVEKFFGGDFKTNNLYFFSGNGGAGSGATGSSQPGDIPIKTRTEFNALTPQQKDAFTELVGQGKAQLVQG